jgi:nucleoid-associated protein YgaU
LFDIARHELGKASRWAEIYRLNREQLGDDFNYLSPGMQLVMPERDDQADPIASRPRREGYRR